MHYTNAGIGEPLLGRDEGHHSALPVQPPDSPKPPPVFCRPPSTPLLSRGKRKGPCVPPTPRSNCRQRISFYSGLESPAAVKWLTSPAIARSASSTAIHFEVAIHLLYIMYSLYIVYVHVWPQRSALFFSYL